MDDTLGVQNGNRIIAMEEKKCPRTNVTTEAMVFTGDLRFNTSVN